MSKSSTKNARMNFLHFKILVKRYFYQLFSSPQTFFALLLQVPVMLLILSIIYETDSFTNPKKLYAANTTIFVLVIISCFMALLGSYREIIKEREILSREISGGLDAVSYVASKLFVLAIIGLFQTAFLVGGSLLFMDFNFRYTAYGILFFFLSIYLVNLSSTALGLLISAIIKKSESAVLPVLLVIICEVVFSGALLDLEGIVVYIQYLVPSYWGLAMFGRSLDMTYKPVYEHELWVSASVLIIMTAAIYLLTVFLIKRSAKNKG